MIVPLSKNIYVLKAPNRSRYPYCNCLFINDDIKAVIDNSCGKENLDFLMRENLNVIINSHFHEDHVLNNPSFPKAEIWAHRLDAPAIRALDVMQEYYGFKNLEEKQLGLSYLEAIGYQESMVDRELEDGDILNFGRVELRVILTAGHTPGHCCFYEEKEGLLFSADIDLSDFGPWYGHDCSDVDDFIASINKCIDINPAIVVTSHNDIFKENIIEAMKKYLNIIYKKEEILFNYLKIPSTLESLAEKQIYYGYYYKQDEPFHKISEKMAIEKLLKRLLKQQAIKKEGDIYWR